MRRTQATSVVLPLLVVLQLLGCSPGTETRGTVEPQPVDINAKIEEASLLLDEGRLLEAVAALEAVVELEPDAASAWLLLARGRRRSGELDGALEAARRAETFAAVRGGALRERFLIHLAQGELEAAAEDYEELRQALMVDFSSLHLAPETEALRDEARFASLFPSDFDDPFVEEVEVLHEWRGDEPGDELGWEARNTGDVDGDGTNDAVVSAPAHEPLGDGAGEVFVYSGRDGSLLWTVRGGEKDLLGVGIEGAGDVDGDGVPDVVAGAPGAGKAYVYSGNDGELLRTFSAPGEHGDSYGSKVAGAGDVDGDGYGDVLVGSPGSAGGAGRAMLYSGRDAAALASWEGKDGEALGSAVAGASGDWGTLVVIGVPNGGPESKGRVQVYRGPVTVPAFVIDAAETGSQLGGMFVSVVGDVDADGMPDVYASDWMDSAAGPVTGRVVVVSGRDGSLLLDLVGEGPGEGFGIGPARAGDVDGDGHDDLVIGAWQHRSAAHSGGKVTVFSGRDGSELRTFTGRIPGETLGFDADGMGDVDGDAVPDLLLTSAWSLVNGPRSGRAMIVSGRTAPAHSDERAAGPGSR